MGCTGSTWQNRPDPCRLPRSAVYLQRRVAPGGAVTRLAFESLTRGNRTGTRILLPFANCNVVIFVGVCGARVGIQLMVCCSATPLRSSLLYRAILLASQSLALLLDGISIANSGMRNRQILYQAIKS